MVIIDQVGKLEDKAEINTFLFSDKEFILCLVRSIES